jgi:predicted ABC-type transport system involved in lysophospholipase L1 biosynthesis ATPase subunit
MTADEPLLTVRGLVKNYQALRPLRLQSFTLRRGEIVAMSGLDSAAAEMFVGLLTGAVLPDSGEVQVLGRTTRDVPDSEAWLAMLDRVGIVTDRAVLIAQFTVGQNMAMPFTLEVDPVAPETRARVELLAREVGVAAEEIDLVVAQAPAAVQARVRLARALALEPMLLVAEHPSATLPRDAVKSFAADMGRVARARDVGLLALTADEVFATALGGTALTLEPATGVLRPPTAWSKIIRAIRS